MSYESPITAIWNDLQTQYEDGVLKAAQNYGFDVNKDELTKALMYDRNQYEKGYKDRDAEIIRCKDCKWYEKWDEDSSYGYCHAMKHCHYSKHWEINIYRTYNEDFFCADAERREEE